jgi:hypothetical protein
MNESTKATVADYGSTAVGGSLGLDQIYASIHALTVDGATGQEWVALVKGIVLVVFGFFAWRRQQPVK